MRVDEIAGIHKKRYKDYRLTKGVSRRGGEVGDISDMAKRSMMLGKECCSKKPRCSKNQP